MATVRTSLSEAMRALRAIAPGDDPVADELAVGLEAAQNLVLDLHEARGPMVDIDVAADYIAGENQRVRIQAGASISVTLPNAVQVLGYCDPSDYGFIAPALYPAPGTLAAADGVQYRQPADGSRIEIVGTSQALYFYRADLNQWLPAVGLTIDSELPLNSRLNSAFAALLAERLLDVVSAGPAPPSLAGRLARARTALFLRPGVTRQPVRAEYF